MPTTRRPIVIFFTPASWSHPIAMLKATGTTVFDSDRVPARIAAFWFRHTPDDWRNYFY